MTGKAWTIGGVAVLLLGAGTFGITQLMSKKASATGPVIPEDLTVAKIKETVKENPDKVFDKMRETMDRKDLTEEQRDKIRDNMREVMEAEMQVRVDEYFAAKDESEKEAILDKHIDEFQKLRKRMEKRREEEEAKRAEKDGKTEKEREAEREKRREEWRKRENSRTREEKKTRTETRNPNQMALRAAYFGAMQKQMAKRGIEGGMRFGPFGGRGGRGGPGGPGGPPRSGGG